MTKFLIFFKYSRNLCISSRLVFSVIHSYLLLWMRVLAGTDNVFAKETEGVSRLFWCPAIRRAVSTDWFRSIWETKVDSLIYCYSMYIHFRKCSHIIAVHIRVWNFESVPFSPIEWKSKSPPWKSHIHFLQNGPTMCISALWLVGSSFNLDQYP